MSNPTSEQSPYDAPQQPQQNAVPEQTYGAPAYGAPDPQFGIPQQPYGAPGVPVAQSNGLATAGLILGILPTSVVGAIVSILGIVRAGKVGGVGRARAWVGLVLSVLWTIVSVIVIAALLLAGTSTGKKIVERVDPGCVAAESYMSSVDSKMNADTNNPDAIKADIQAAIDELNKDAGKSHSTKAAADMRATAKDFQELLTDINTATAPSADLQSRVATDANAIDTDCGR